MSGKFHTRLVTSLGRPEERVPLNIADEVPVRLVFNDIFPYGMMMMTPGDVEDFAFGYCLTEGILDRSDQIRSVEVSDGDDGLTLNVVIAGECLTKLLGRRPRAQTGHSSCGICGSDDIPAVDTPGKQPFPLTARIAPDAIRRALHDLDHWQELNARTRMVHGAAWASIDGQIHLIREDVGRHNALDKLIGARMRGGALAEGGICLLTSRYSYEMALKTTRAAMDTVVAVSAPTDRALRMAEQMNQTLIAIARHNRQFVFCGGARLIS
ncbi:formate dehydrogenase accessory sulfurtransferase FdhD [Acetobacter oeni]|uniref:Sulfur carrier protein FdhD n=1 Tax=Acetobacter oeni TaxID=304077 RepID=A0A511XNI6_9PROT|nr:formate dehydrogenase accessory sulfurtransferase FdhD [Acetobacter oeni]MBB3884326.1 FdhD protein [Acetobacter oeni]NHO20319.1 formate dehydrogenase accessory sulfurtransferase FdhD [Acetobacter oeni]GBR05217.1 formate dehydrogenase accessory protein FdhD [Acetobacter oeni LMG 21952]GEN64496.1 sulfurtransferase FdhD [Acetobacter oeni]